MKKTIMIATIAGFLSATAAQAANTGGLPDYPASNGYERIYKQQQYWKNKGASKKAPIERTVDKAKCSDYPRSIEKKRWERSLGIDKKCKN